MNTSNWTAQWIGRHPLAMGEITKAGRDSAEMAREIRMVVGRMSRRFRVQSPNRESIAELTILSHVERLGAATLAQIAAAAGVRPQSLHTSVASLVDNGLVTRMRDEVDRRQVLLAITDAGRRKLAEIRAARESWLANTIEEHLDAQERQTLAAAVELLDRITAM